MAVTPANVDVAITGAVSRGLTSATAPTSEVSAITGFTDLGGISEDGVQLALPDAGDSTPIKVWQNGATVRTVRSASDDLPTLVFTMLETSLQTVETYFGVTVDPDDGSFEYVVENRSAASYVLDVIDGAKLWRVYVPQGVVTAVTEITLANAEAIGYGVTIEAELHAVKGYNFKSWHSALIVDEG